jgi:hypothetical protein
MLRILDEKYIENSKDVISNYTHYKSGESFYPNPEWAKWFLSQDRASKEKIAYRLKNNPELRAALISNWFDFYRNQTSSNIDFEKFLDTDFTVYRGETSRDLKFGEAAGFASYTLDKSMAKHFANDGNGTVIELIVKPRNTYGMIDSVGAETEVLIPTNFSDGFMRKELDELLNNNMWVLDKLSNEQQEYLSELEQNKKFEEIIDFLRRVISSNL